MMKTENRSDDNLFHTMPYRRIIVVEAIQ